MRILLTGGAGFVGHHFVEHFLKNTDADLVVLDRLNYASGGFDRLRDIEAFDDDRVLLLTHDFTKPLVEGIAKEIGKVDYIIHMGAESHVDKSIEDAEPFVRSNVLGTMHMLDFAWEQFEEQKCLKCFFYFSTDEVFGPAPDDYSYKEEDRHNPTNPYAATKSGGEMLANAYRNTYKLPVIITRSMNIIGERQHPEKFIPLIVNKVRAGETVTIHGYPDKTRAGSRFYIHGRNVADGYLHLINMIEQGYEAGKKEGQTGYVSDVVGQDYHITGEKEVDNLELAKLIAEQLGQELKYEITDFHSTRPGHDLRYALDGTKMADIGWTPPKTFEESLRKTIDWMIDPVNEKWLKL